jgi:dTDP-4-amino-4,6-dideoxygalactose transaminase
MFGAPQPRSRIYTRPSIYARLLGDLAFGRFASGPGIVELEKTMCALLGVRHAIATSTARTALYLTLSALIKPGQKVILSPITIVDVVNMVICAGGIPVFADVEPNTCNIDPQEIERLIDKNTGAVLITHLHGLACDVKKIRAICDAHNVPLLEDAAQAFSTRVGGKWAGTFGRAGIFSFGMYKIVNVFFGGMITTDDDAMAQRIREQLALFPVMAPSAFVKKLAHGLMTDISTAPVPFSMFSYWVFRYGYLNEISALNGMVSVDRHPMRKNELPNSYKVRMSPAQARLIPGQLPGVEANNQARIAAANLYYQGLKDIPEITLPPHLTDGSHIYTYYAFRAPDRHALMRYALKHKRDLVVSHYHNCAALPIFSDFYRSCPNADATAKELLYLPTYPRYDVTEIHKNIAVTRSYFRQ